jgi:hypothetical protein
MGQGAVGIRVPFPAMGLVPIETEAVEKALGLAGRLLHECLAELLEGLKVLGGDIEVRDDGTALILRRHVFLLNCCGIWTAWLTGNA